MTNSNPISLWKATDFFHLSVFAFGSTAFGTSLGVAVLPVLVLAVAPEEFKNTYLGILSLAGLIVAMVVQPLAGHISDDTNSPWGRRVPYVVAGGLLTCLAAVVLGAASTLFVLAVGLILAQLCLNIALGPYQALVRDIVPSRQRSVAASFKILAEGSGGIVFLVLVSFLIGRYRGPESSAWLWLCLTLMSLTMASAAVWTAITIRVKEDQIGSGAGSGTGGPEHEAHPQFAWFLGSRFCCTAALAAIQTYAVYFFRDVLGIENPAEAVGLMALVAGIGFLLATYPAGRLSDRVGRKWVMMASAMMGSGGAFSLLLISGVPQVLLVGLLLGAAAGAFLSVSWAMATDLVSSFRTGQQMGIANIAALAGSVLARLAGPGIDLLEHIEVGLGYSALVTMCGVLLIVGAMLLIPIRTTTSPSTAAVA